MMDRADMVKVIDSLPWPEATKPLIELSAAECGGCIVELKEPRTRGWKVRARVHGPTPEGVFGMALERWLTEKGINNQPIFFDAIRRLKN